MVSSLTCSGLAPTLARTAATSLPSSRSRAHASRAIPPVALGIEQNPSGVPERMGWLDSSVQFVALGAKNQLIGAHGAATSGGSTRAVVTNARLRSLSNFYLHFV